MNLLTKIMQFIHRILGTALSILFLVWFLSGLVMIYHTFPRADRAEGGAAVAAGVDPLPCRHRRAGARVRERQRGFEGVAGHAARALGESP